MLPVCEFYFPAPLKLAKAGFGLNLVGGLWALTQVELVL